MNSIFRLGMAIGFGMDYDMKGEGKEEGDQRSTVWTGCLYF